MIDDNDSDDDDDDDDDDDYYNDSIDSKVHVYVGLSLSICIKSWPTCSHGYVVVNFLF